MCLFRGTLQNRISVLLLRSLQKAAKKDVASSKQQKRRAARFRETPRAAGPSNSRSPGAVPGAAQPGDVGRPVGAGGLARPRAFRAFDPPLEGFVRGCCFLALMIVDMLIFV